MRRKYVEVIVSRAHKLNTYYFTRKDYNFMTWESSKRWSDNQWREYLCTYVEEVVRFGLVWLLYTKNKQGQRRRSKNFPFNIIYEKKESGLFPSRRDDGVLSIHFTHMLMNMYVVK